MYKIVAIVCGLLFFSTAASAQRFNAFVGYSYTNWRPPLPCFLEEPTHAAFQCVNPAGQRLQGWEVSVGGTLIPHLGLVADVSGHYGTEAIEGTVEAPVRLYNLLAGPQVSVSIGRFSPFAHELLGASTAREGAHFVPPSPFSFPPFSFGFSFSNALGGGIDYRIIPLVSARVQADWLLTRFVRQSEPEETTHNNSLRFSAGLVFHF
jgi:hypothetical protein